jgi:ketosteroid isomerase-like protein
MPRVSEAESDLIRASYGALNRGDVDGALSALHRDAVWSESPQLPGGDVFEGREQIREFLTGFLEQWQVFHQQVTSTIAEGDRVCVLIHLTAVGRGSGVEVDARYAHLWHLRDGLGAAVDAYYDPELALAELRATPG